MFVAAERASVIYVYDITTPTAPVFLHLAAVHDCSLEPAVRTSLMKDPESLEFIPANMSPTGYDTLIVGGAASNTVTTFKVAKDMPEDYYMCTDYSAYSCPAGCKKIEHFVNDLTAPIMRRRLLFGSFVVSKPTKPKPELNCPRECIAE